MNIENLNLGELDAQEVQELEGGGILSYINFFFLVFLFFQNHSYPITANSFPSQTKTVNLASVQDYTESFDSSLGLWLGLNVSGANTFSNQTTWCTIAGNKNQAVASEDWLVSPGLIIPQGSNYQLLFDLATNYGTDSANKLQLLVSTNYQGNHTTATWTPLVLNAADSDYLWRTNTYDLANYSGQTIHIAFKHTSDGSSGATRNYRIDNFKVYQSKDILENNVPQNWQSNAPMSMSTAHYKNGKQSLKWDWNSGSKITVTNLPNIDFALSRLRGGIVIWIYSENKLNDYMNFDFISSKTLNSEYHFKVYMNYKGWRAIWVRFDEDMSGSKLDNSINKMIITAPSTGSGTYFFDKLEFGDFGRDLNTGYAGESNRLMPDYQLPFINDSAANTNHWLRIYRYSQLTPTIIDEPSVSISQQKDMDSISNRYKNYLLDVRLLSTSISQAKADYNSLNIEVDPNGNVKGKPLFCHIDYVVNKLAKNIDPTVIGTDFIDKFIMTLVRDYKINGSTESRDMVLNVFRHYLDQGFAEGSGIGTVDQHGYAFRNISSAVFLMKDELHTAGILDELQGAVKWYGSRGAIWYQNPYSGENLDALNTTSVALLASILVMDDTPEKVTNFKGFKNWLNNGFSYAPGTLDAFKPDGTSFHHGGHYPAYIRNSFNSIARTLSFLRETTFMIDTAQHHIFRNALYMMNIISNKDWAMGSSGRHVLKEHGVYQMKDAFYYGAILGDPDSNATIDPLIGKAYTRLFSGSVNYKPLGIAAESLPLGNWSYNHAALNIHRHGSWLATIKGYNKDVWSTEIYQKENRYGRYISNGSVELTNSNGQIASGLKKEGFDWNRIPGATYIYKNFDTLESPFPGTLLDRGDLNSFSGSVSFEGNYGAFGVSLQESNYTNFDPSFTAKKSVFSFEDRIVCLGSNISNSNTSNYTETALFQGLLTNVTMPIYLNSTIGETSFPYSNVFNSTTNNNWFLDAYGTGYYIPKGQTVHVKRSLQISKDPENKTSNQGNFSLAWIDHGLSPTNASYEFAILMHTTPSGIANFKNQMEGEATKLYTILQQDNKAHVLKDKPTGIIAYVLFESNSNLNQGYLKSNSLPSIVMIKNNGDNTLKLTMSNPDLNMNNNYSGGIEQPGTSQKLTTQLTLLGSWSITDNNPSNYRIVSNTGTETVLEFDCINGIPINANLAKQLITFSTAESNATNDNVIIYPNPFKNAINITITNNKTKNTQYALISIYNTAGVLVSHRKVNLNNDFDLSELSAGVYTARIEINENVFIKKIIKK